MSIEQAEEPTRLYVVAPGYRFKWNEQEVGAGDAVQMTEQQAKDHGPAVTLPDEEGGA